MATVNIEEKAIQTYNENILFLQNKHPEIFAKIDALENAIANGYYEDKYSLEYKDGYFDVLEKSTGNFLYSKDSNIFAHEIAKSINFNKTDNLFQIYNKFELTDANAEELENLSTQESSLSASAKLINYSNNYANAKNTTMKKLYKFIFVGAGLGLHIKAVHQKIHSNIYLIIEDDLELFKLSLFVTNYAKIDKDGSEIVFSVFDDDEFETKIQLFLDKQFIYNHYIKFFNLVENNAIRLKDIQKIIVGQNYLNFNFSSLTKDLLRPLSYIQDSYNILNLNSLSQSNLFSDKPILLLGAGPSLGKNINWLKNNQDKFIIISISTILSELERYDIKPDIITHLNGSVESLKHIQKVKDLSFFDNSISIFSSMSLPEFTKYFKKENTFVFENNSQYKENFGNLVSDNVGSISYALALKLRVKDIYLLGIDFALDQETGSTHISTHQYVTKVKLQEDKTVNGELDYEMDVIKIKGNFKDKVYSTIMYNKRVIGLDKIYKNFNTNQTKNIYNLSDGAYINHTKPLVMNNINLDKLEKKNLYSQLKQQLKKHSQNFLNENEKDKIRYEISESNAKLDIIKTYKGHENILSLFNSLLNSKPSSLSSILTLYFQFISTYIFDILNTKEISNQKELDKLFVPQIKKIILNYKNYLANFLLK